MQDVWLRVFLAATISAMGFLGTWVWSGSYRLKKIDKDDAPIARVVSTDNEVLRRPAQRLIFQRALTSEELFSGEAIRTGPTGTARIEFIGRDTYAELDPNTLIEIEETSKGLNLDFLVGNLVIRTHNKNENSGITVQSGQQKIEVKDVEVAMVKPAAASAVDVDVIKGASQNVKVTGPQDQPVREIPKIKIVSPKRGDVYYADPGKGSVVSFVWEPMPGIDQDVILETGKEQHTLKPDTSVTPVPMSSGRLEARLKPGKIYYRLKAKGQANLTSVASSFELKPKLPPELQEPAPDAHIEVTATSKLIDFSWANHGELEDLKIEISGAPDLKNTIIAQPVEKALHLSFQMPEGAGPFFWRVSGRIPNTAVMISSQIRKFTVGKGELPPLAAPELASPAHESKIPYQVMHQDGVWLEWKPVKGADRYDLVLIGDKEFKKSASSTRMSVMKLPPGDYKWSVVARHGANRESPSSETRGFSVLHNPVLPWADGLLRTKQIFKSLKPTVKLAWQKGPGVPVKYRVRVTSARAPASDVDWQPVEAPEYTTTLDGVGQFNAEAESLDANGEVIARTPLRTMELELAPPLRPPEHASPLVIKAHADGTADVEWRPVSEAKEYVLQVKSKEGDVVQTHRIASTKARVKGLAPGDYTVSLQTIDQIDRTGPEGRGRKLSVPSYSSVLPPKIKGLKIR